MEIAGESNEIEDSWAGLAAAELAGPVAIIGASDTGKSTLARWLVARLTERPGRVGWLDADPGQSTLGMPTTLNLAVIDQPPSRTPVPDATFFAGSTTPKGQMLPVLVGVELLARRARELGAGPLVVDTSGLIDPGAGGVALKHWKLALLAVTHVIAFERESELAPILTPLDRDRRLAVHRLRPSPAVRPRSPAQRTARRRALLREYFAAARPRRVAFADLAVYGVEQAAPGRLVAFEDERRLALGLGILEGLDGDHLIVRTPGPIPPAALALRIGAISHHDVAG